MATDPSGLISQLLSPQSINGFQLGMQDAQQRQQASQYRDTQQAVANLQLQQAQQEASQDAAFPAAWEAYQKNPTMDGLAALAVKYPRQADALKQFWAVKEPEVRQNHINAIAPVLSALQQKKPAVDLAVQSLQNMRDATAKAGSPTDHFDAEIAALKSGDPDQITAVKANLMAELAAADPDGKFAESYSRISKAMNGGDSYTLSPGDIRYSGNNEIVARGGPKTLDPFHYTLKDASGQEHEYLYSPQSGQAVPTDPNSPPPSSIGGALDPHQFFKNFVQPHEGGYAAHDANGAPVNMGINQSANPGVNVRNLTPDQAAQIFADKYFGPSGAANLPAPLAAVHADTYFINPARATQFLAASGGDPTKYLQMRTAWQNSLVANQPEKYGRYAKAWANRNADLGQFMQQAGASGGGGDQSGAIAGSVKLDPNPVNNNGVDGLPGDPTKSGDAYLQTIPQGIRSTVKAVASGQMAPPTSFAMTKPYWQQVMAAVTQFDPSYDSSTQPLRVAAAKQFTGNGKAAQVVSSVNRLAYHINDLYRDSRDLSGWNLGPASGLVNSGLQSFEKAALARYNATLPFIAGELQKLSKNGSAAEGETRQIMANLAPTQPASARLAAVQQLVELAQGQFKPIRDQWQAAFPDGRNMPVDISPETNAIFDAVENDHGPVAINGKSGRIVDSQGRAQAPAQRVPAVGFVKNGWRFNGGNPGDRNNWQRVQ